MTYHFPDAYAGQNTKIRDTLNNLILRAPHSNRRHLCALAFFCSRPSRATYRKSPQNWQTSVGLPFFQIEG